MQRRTQILTGFYIGATLLGWLGAFAGSSLVERALPLPAGVNLEEVTVADTTKKPPKKKNKKRARNQAKKQTRLVSSIVKRNIFDSTQVNATPAAKPQAGEIPTSSLNVQLMGTVVVLPEELSMAWIKDADKNEADGYQQGDKIQDALIKKIERQRVIVERNGELELITFDDGEKKSTKKRGGSKGGDQDESGVEKTGRNKYTIDQAVLDEMLKNPEKLTTQIRASQKKKNGDVIGYRLSGIRRKSVFYKLGIKNGDVVHSVNGRPLTSMKEAMDAYKTLQSSKNFTFELTRRRKRRTHEYEVR